MTLGRSNQQGDAIAPLDGEAGIPSVTQATANTLSAKGIVALALLVLSLIGVSAVAVNRALSSDKKDDVSSKRVADRPAAAATEPRQLDMTPTPVAKPVTATAPLIPAIKPIAEDFPAEPIGVRRTTQAPAPGGPPRVPPEDAPVVLITSRPGSVGAGRAATTREVPGAPSESGPGAHIDDPLQDTKRNLEVYQRHLQGLLNTLTKTTDKTAAETGEHIPFPSAGQPAPSHLMSAAASVVSNGANSGLLGGQLQGSATPRVAASMLGNRSLTFPKGTAFTCALKTKVVSAASGFVSCQVQRNVFSDDGRVLLIERGSHLDGEYRIASVRPGTVRIPVLWTRIRTPNGVTVDIDSPATGPLGESGMDGYVDNRWGERIGAAMLLSLIDDTVKLTIQNQASDRQADTIVLPSSTANTSKLAEEVLDSTINIPPLIYQNQGGIVGIYVARDVDFSSVYELQAVSR